MSSQLMAYEHIPEYSEGIIKGDVIRKINRSFADVQFWPCRCDLDCRNFCSVSGESRIEVTKLKNNPSIDVVKKMKPSNINNLRLPART